LRAIRNSRHHFGESIRRVTISRHSVDRQNETRMIVRTLLAAREAAARLERKDGSCRLE
jgi:hypothetical protein